MDTADTALLAALTDNELKQHFGPVIYLRGLNLVIDQAVHGLSHAREGAVSAAQGRVTGSTADAYHVHLTHSVGSRLRGGCDCVYASGNLPCKHQAALAVAWRMALAGEALEDVGPGTASAGQAAAPKASPPTPDWVTFLRAQPSHELADRLITWAGRLPELRRDLQAWHRAATPVADAAEAKKAVTAILAAPPNLYERRNVSAYVRKSHAVLGLLKGWTTSQPGIALAAADWALTKLRKVWETADDSNGEIGGLMGDLARAWLASLHAAGPQTASFGDKYFKLACADDHALFDHPAALAAMGPEAAKRYGDLLWAQWQQVKHSTDAYGPRGATRRQLIDHLQATGDGAAAIATLREGLHDESDHIALIQELQRQGKAREALQGAEAAHRLFPQQRYIEGLLLQAYEADGWDAEALALRRSAFERSPTADTYHAVLKAAQAAGQDVSAERERLWGVLRHLEARQGSYGFSWIGAVRLTIWADEGRFDEALAWLGSPHNLSPRELRRFALRLPEALRDTAADLLKRALAQQMADAKAPYREELDTVRDTLTRLQPAAAGPWLAWLKVEYRAKKRFVESLPFL